MINKTDILTFLRTNREELITRFQLIRIGLFGSFAREEETEDSDIDLIVEFEPGTEDLYQLKQDMKVLFKEAFQKEVDICREKYIKPYYKEQILSDAIFV